jgi:hypothetical protein
MVEIVENNVVQEPQAEAQPGTTQPDDGTLEIQLTQEISELWSVHTRLAANHKTTAKELRQLRAKLAERLYAVKNLLSRPGRGGEWRGWLRERRIPRSTADRLVSRHAETLTGDNGNVPTGAISNSPEDSAEKLAKSVWQRFGKLLTTDESVILFIDRIAELSGVGHERREGGLMIFSPVHKVADGVTGTDAAAEIPCPTPQPAESGEANPADAPAADPNPQLSDDVPAAVDELPASAPATGPAPQPPQGGNAIPAEASAADPNTQPSRETATATEAPAAETTAMPLAAEQVAAAVDAGGSDAA